MAKRKAAAPIAPEPKRQSPATDEPSAIKNKERVLVTSSRGITSR